jgi:1-acyl-sn-glycerol-3-phosphate acyltransferase
VNRTVQPDPARPDARVGRDALVSAITTFLAAGREPKAIEAVRVALERELDAAGPRALLRLDKRLAHAGVDWTYYRRDPLARRIHSFLADRILEPSSALFGLEHLRAVAGQPVVLVANHLSYSDANLLEVLLRRAGGAEVADRLTVIAGPKVYSSLNRRFSSLCFGTIKTPQSSALSSEDAVMNAREVARAARRSIDIAHDRLRKGEALLVFAEGTRSRTSELQPLLTGVTRYLDGPAAWVLPVGIVGTEALFPIGEEALHPVRAMARVGRPIAAAALREQSGDNRRLMMDVLGLAIAGALPAEYRGAYADQAPDLEAARQLLNRLSSGAAS